ncbi:MAG: adenosylcobinamide amidohydrolase [Candidatus Methylomirabilia bacterium]
MDGVRVEVDHEGVVVSAATLLQTVSSAVVGGGMAMARSIVNLHVPKNFPCDNPDRELATFVRRRGIPSPYLGLMTSTRTEKAEVVEMRGNNVHVMAVVTVGLGNPVHAGQSPLAAWQPSTINTIVVVDGAPEPSALVNLVITATEAKAMALLNAGLRCPDGQAASGTSTDAVVVAATGRGPRCRFGGPVSSLGWVVSRAVGSALDAGIRRWVKERS